MSVPDVQAADEEAHNAHEAADARDVATPDNPDGRRPHIGLVAFYFPPSRASGVYRMLALANHLVTKGWDVTVLTVTPDFFEHITRSADPSLLDSIDPRVHVERVPLPMRHLEQELRRFGPWRGNYPELHRRVTQRLIRTVWCDQYGSWVPGVVRRLLEVHRRHRFDLTLATGNPYSCYQAVWTFRRLTKVPYVLDSRDSWTLNLFTDECAFPPGHAAFTWEKRTFADAALISFVNTPLLAWHQREYPQDADKMIVVANGYDATPAGGEARVSGNPEQVAAGPAQPTPDPLPSVPQDLGAADPAAAESAEAAESAADGEQSARESVHFGYVGTLTANQPHAIVWEGWRLAKDAGRLPEAVVDLYGHLGFFGVSAAVRNTLPLDDPSQEVTWHGAVGKAQIAEAYDSLDVLLMIVADSPYVTSGKVFEYMSTGKPVLGLYEGDCAVAEVLADYPLLVRTASLEPDDIAEAFVRAAQLAPTVTRQQRQEARAFARRFERTRQLKVLETHLRRIVDNQAVRSRLRSPRGRPGTGAGAGAGARAGDEAATQSPS